VLVQTRIGTHVHIPGFWLKLHQLFTGHCQGALSERECSQSSLLGDKGDGEQTEGNKQSEGMDGEKVSVFSKVVRKSHAEKAMFM